MQKGGDANGFKGRAADRGLYAVWLDRNFENSVKRSAFLAAASMTVVVLLDTLLFSDPLRYAPLQLVAVLLYIGAVGSLSPQFTSIFRWLKRSEIFLWGPHLFLTFAYLYFLETCPEGERWIVLTGTFMTLFFTQMAVYEFKRSSMILMASTVAFVSLRLARVEDPSLHNSFVLSLIFVGVAWIFFARRRWEFIKGLEDRYKILSNIFPPFEARMISVAQNDLEFTNLFAPRMRPAVCLSTDWRGYQEIAARMNPKELSAVTDRFCEFVVDALQEFDPKGHHYITWVADLLFIIFYDEEDRLGPAIERATQFTRVYCTRVFARARKEIFSDILFDVGLSAGEGLLGLQGAKSIKKTTITSPHAGTANRLEREAKLLRKQDEQSLDRPIVCIDSVIQEYLEKNGLVLNEKISRIQVTERDLQNGSSYYRWDYRSMNSNLHALGDGENSHTVDGSRTQVLDFFRVMKSKL